MKKLIFALILVTGVFANNFFHSDIVTSKGDVKVERFFNGLAIDKAKKTVYVTQMQAYSINNLNSVKSIICKNKFFGPLVKQGYTVIYTLLSTDDRAYEVYKIDNCDY